MLQMQQKANFLLIDQYIFDKKGRLNFRRFDTFETKFPLEYKDILEYSKDFQMKDTSFRYQFLVWRYQIGQSDLICRRDGCVNTVGWKHLIPMKLCSNNCRTLDGATTGINLKVSNLKKFGVTSTAKLEKTKEKFKKSILKSNNVKNKDKYYDIDFIKATFLDKLNHFKFKEFMDFFGVIQPTAHNHMIKLKIDYVKTLSAGEKDVKLFVESLGVSVISNTRRIIGPKEIDIYIPDHKLALEYNGLYWHSYGKEHLGNNIPITQEKYRHISKTLLCDDLGIALLHIWQSEWENTIHRSIWKNIIRYKLGLINNRVGSRKATLKELSTKDRAMAGDFLDKYHLQGKGTHWTYAFGLYLNNMLVQIMTFGKSRYNDSEIELLRFATKIDLVLPGGASRLLSAFEKKYTPKSIHTFADLRFSDGNIYNVLGFKKVCRVTPNFKVFKNNSLLLEPREKYQKHKLSKIMSYYDPNQTAVYNMVKNDFRIIWDCGNISFKKEY